MTIIEIAVPVLIHYTPVIHKKHDGTEVTEQYEKIYIDIEKIMIKCIECDGWCECDKNNNSKHNEDADFISNIKEIINSEDRYNYQKIEAIHDILNNSMYGEIKNILVEQPWVGDEIDDESWTSDKIIRIKKIMESKYDDDNITRVYPYCVL